MDSSGSESIAFSVTKSHSPVNESTLNDLPGKLHVLVDYSCVMTRVLMIMDIYSLTALQVSGLVLLLLGKCPTVARLSVC